MGADAWIIFLTAVGLLLVLAEVFLPGGVTGAIGGCCLFAAMVVCGIQHGFFAGTVYFIAMTVVGLAVFFVWLHVFPRTFAGRRLMHTRTLEGASAGVGSVLVEVCPVGALGVAVTPLRPAGTANFGGKRMDVAAESGLIEAGSPIVVRAVEGSRVVVAKVLA